MAYPMNSKANTMFIGTTRSGKTTAMLHVIKRSVAANEPVFIISGKTGINDKYSMYSQVKALCNMYNRKLYVISTHMDYVNTVSYNPFKYSDIQSISNTLTIIAKYSDTHYESCFEFWVISICEIIERLKRYYLEKTGEVKFISLPNIMKLFSWNKFAETIVLLKEEGYLSNEEFFEYMSYQDIAEVAQLSRARFLKYLKGSGARIFNDNDSISVMDIRRENAVFLIDLDGLMFKDFSFALGTMIVSDLRSMISQEKDVESRKLIVFDELSVFFSVLLPDIYSQANGFGFQSIIGSQSFADMDNISPDLAERMIENSHIFGFLLQNSASDAERAAKIMGTKKTSEVTRRMDGANFSATGSTKVIDQFKIHPDQIKELNPLEMFVYDKTSKTKIPELIKWEYLNLNYN